MPPKSMNNNNNNSRFRQGRRGPQQGNRFQGGGPRREAPEQRNDNRPRPVVVPVVYDDTVNVHIMGLHAQGKKKLRIFLPLTPLYPYCGHQPENQPTSTESDTARVYNTWRDLPSDPAPSAMDDSVTARNKRARSEGESDSDMERGGGGGGRASTSKQGPDDSEEDEEDDDDEDAERTGRQVGVDDGGGGGNRHDSAADAFHCDACQRSFRTPEAYATHMERHVYCEVPGCKFTCVKDKPWKMEQHVELLHNRPNAPDLIDTAKYLSQRRNRFPTQENVKREVEELYYKAARGVLLPEDRRRWLRQHGITIGRQPRTQASFIARGSLPVQEDATPHPPLGEHQDAHEGREGSHAHNDNEGGGTATDERATLAGNKQGERGVTSPNPSPSSSSSSSLSSRASSLGGGRRVGDHNSDVRSSHDTSVSGHRKSMEATAPAASAPPATTTTTTTTADEEQLTVIPPAFTVGTGCDEERRGDPHPASTSTPQRPKRPIPLGPNGTFTRQQMVQMVRERYADSTQVPRFYVCNRCGTKGEHWVGDCPTKGDTTYDRHLEWGEPKRAAGDAGSTEEASVVPKPATTAATTTTLDVTAEGSTAAPTPTTIDSSPPTTAPDAAVEATHPSAEDTGSDDAPEAVSAKAAPHHSPGTTPSATEKERTKVIAPVAASKLAARSTATGRGRGPGGVLRPPPPPSLYEKLTEEERLTERGLLLQAIRFFVTREFFDGSTK